MPGKLTPAISDDDGYFFEERKQNFEKPSVNKEQVKQGRWVIKETLKG